MAGAQTQRLKNIFSQIDGKCFGLKKDDLVLYHVQIEETLSQSPKYILHIASLIPDLSPSFFLKHLSQIQIHAELHNHELDKQNRVFVKKDICGYVISFEILQDVSYHKKLSSKIWKYKLVLGSWLDVLDSTRDSRFFRNTSIVNILNDIISKYDSLPFYLDRSNFDVWSDFQITQCMQYQESDSSFLKRIIEENGCYFYFENRNGHNCLVIKSCQNKSCRTMKEPFDRSQKKMKIFSLNTKVDLQKDCISTVYDNDSEFSSSEFYSVLPHKNQERYPELSEYRLALMPFDVEENQRYQKHQTYLNSFFLKEIYTGKTNWHGFGVGSAILGDDNNFYRIISEKIEITETFFQNQNAQPYHCTHDFFCIPIAEPISTHFYPSLQIGGIHKATVVSDSYSSQEKTTFVQNNQVLIRYGWDKYFDKDKEHKMTYSNSASASVAFPWAGQGHGACFYPPVGSVVFIVFINKDPNRPVVIGAPFSKNNISKINKKEKANQHGFFTKQGSHLFLYDDSHKEKIDFFAKKNLEVKSQATFSMEQKKLFLKTIDKSFLQQKNYSVISSEKIVIHVGKSRIDMSDLEGIIFSAGEYRFSVGQLQDVFFALNSKEDLSF